MSMFLKDWERIRLKVVGKYCRKSILQGEKKGYHYRSESMPRNQGNAKVRCNTIMNK